MIKSVPSERDRTMTQFRVLETPILGTVCSEKGGRDYMEDFNILLEYELEGQKGFLYAIFDGHGGATLASDLRQKLPLAILSRLRSGMEIQHVKNLITQVFLEQDLRYQNYTEMGSTAILALKFKNILYLINLGDSRGVVFDSSGTIRLQTRDHKPHFLEEKTRILAAGGSVTSIGGAWRVNGQLAVSRSFGDYALKESPSQGPSQGPNRGPITSIPDILTLPILPGKTLYILLASDGLWDVFSSADAIIYLKNVSADCRVLVESAIRDRGSLDNVTVLVGRI